MNALAPAKSDGNPVPVELLPIALMCSGSVRYFDEASRKYVHMIGLHFFVRGTEKEMDTLLCLNYTNANYPTKLYLPANLGLGLNWNETAFILGKAWHTWSWKGVSAAQAPVAILADHLAAFR